MWQIAITHTELNLFKVVRGNTQAEAQLKASLQMKIWNERWEKKQAAAFARERIYDKRTIATEATTEANLQVSAIEALLRSNLDQPPPAWDSFRISKKFDKPEPSPPSAPHYPAKPDFTEFEPSLSVFDRLIPSRQAAKRSTATGMFNLAVESWQQSCDLLRAQFASENEGYSQKLASWKSERKAHGDSEQARKNELAALEEKYCMGDPNAIEFLCNQTLLRSPIPDNFPKEFALAYNAESRQLLVDFDLPNQQVLPRIKEVRYIASRNVLSEVLLSDAWRKKAYDEVLYQITLLTLHRLFTADQAAKIQSIIFNGWVESIDAATGNISRKCILSIQVHRDEFIEINLAQVDAKACFRKLKGVAASKLTELTPIRPILTLDKEDSRFVEGYSVTEHIGEGTNLAAMDWLDFENLIREIFEKEFAKNGGEVKITQASRDGGVDAVAFDPDPIRGGKIVIQAKRYTNVVGVSAVRDLFGTVQHEGATKGILVTTSMYGPDAYEFARDKPLTLLNGAELLGLLERHGRRARIDIAEARLFAH